MISTTPTVLAALSAGAVLVNALPVEDGPKPGNTQQDPFAVLDPQEWVNPDDSRSNATSSCHAKRLKLKS